GRQKSGDACRASHPPRATYLEGNRLSRMFGSSAYRREQCAHQPGIGHQRGNRELFRRPFRRRESHYGITGHVLGRLFRKLGGSIWGTMDVKLPRRTITDPDVVARECPVIWSYKHLQTPWISLFINL